MKKWFSRHYPGLPIVDLNFLVVVLLVCIIGIGIVVFVLEWTSHKQHKANIQPIKQEFEIHKLQKYFNRNWEGQEPLRVDNSCTFSTDLLRLNKFVASKKHIRLNQKERT